MILLNLFYSIRGTLYDVRAFQTFVVWYAHPFYLDEASNQSSVSES